jgi:hypothetical protein
VRLGLVATEHQQLHLAPGRAAQEPPALERGHVACRLIVDPADEVASPQPGLGGGRALANRHHPQVVLTGQNDPHVGGAGGLTAFGRLDEIGSQVRAVGVEAVGQTLEGAAHGAPDVHFLDVIVEDESDNLFEDRELAEGVVLASTEHTAQVAANDGERDDGRRDGENPEPSA